MGTPTDSGPVESGRPGKVATLISEYDLDGLGDELERRWTADGDARESLRDLADRFNRELLRQTATDAGVQLLDGEVENLYRLLTSDGVSQADRTRAKRRLERQGIDVDSLRTDFVTYQAVRTYLQKHRDAEYQADNDDRLEREAENIDRLRGRTASVTTSKLAQLRDTDQLRLGEFRTLIDLQVVCEDCGSRYEVGTLLERGGCDCQPGDA